MSRRYSPLTCCDRDCAGANNCTMGGVECPDCGCWYCPVSHECDEDGRCDDCAERHRRELEEEELEQEDEDGE